MNAEGTFLNWTFEQWAIAAARLGTPEPTFKGANELQKRWQTSNIAAPGEIRLEGVDIPKDWETPRKLWMMAVTSGLHPASLA